MLVIELMSINKDITESIGRTPYSAVKGAVVGESTTSQITVKSKAPFDRGEYVIIGEGDEAILGWVEESISRNDLVEHVVDVDSELSQIALADLNDGEYTEFYAKVRLLSLLKSIIKEGKVVPPRRAPLPGTTVKKADDNTLKQIFTKDGDKEYIRIGVLSAHPQVPFYVNVNKMVSRHLAIVAITGAGKSNTVSVITERLVKEKRGTVVIFDMHGEYKDALESKYVNNIEPKLDPTKLDVDAYVKLLNLKNAAKQELFLRNMLKIWRVLREANFYKRSEDFFDALTDMIMEMMKNKKLPIIRNEYIVIEMLKEYLMTQKVLPKDQPLRLILNIASLSTRNKFRICMSNPRACERAINVLELTESDKNSSLPSLLVKLEDARVRYDDIFEFNVLDIDQRLERGKLNVIDMSHLDEDMADIVASIYLRKMLIARKNAVHEREGSKLNFPVFVVLEEAHILAPQNRNTLTKYWVSRITREGRKFGLGLAMISQRPKGLDQDALSQANNLIVLRLVEPTDQRHVQESSESLSEELVKQLPSLATGEAIVLGPMAPLPAIVKIDKASKTKVGSDLDIVDLWMNEKDIAGLGTNEEERFGDEWEQ